MYYCTVVCCMSSVYKCPLNQVSKLLPIFISQPPLLVVLLRKMRKKWYKTDLHEMLQTCSSTFVSCAYATLYMYGYMYFGVFRIIFISFCQQPTQMQLYSRQFNGEQKHLKLLFTCIYTTICAMFDFHLTPYDNHMIIVCFKKYDYHIFGS